MNDLRFGIRQLFKHRGHTAVAMLTIALGIGVTTALFSVVYGVLIAPYPYAKPGEIWTPGLRSADSDQRMRPYRLDEFHAMTNLPTFSSVMATAPGTVLLTGDFAPETITGIRVSANAFRFLGVQPILGRTIHESDVQSTGEPNPVTVLSYGGWKRLFGGDTNVIGRTLRLNDEPHTVIGVMPPRFGWWTDSGVWLPMGNSPLSPPRVFPIVRLVPGTPPEIARQQLHGLQLELRKANPAGFPREDFASTLTNYLDITAASGEMQRSLQLLFGAVGFLLLIACANVANLQLARASSRAREMAIRQAIGARRARLVRQLLTENVLTSCLGGLLGLLLAFAITRVMVSLMPGFYVPNEARIEVNGFVLGFCLLVSTLTGILFGLAPAIQLSRPILNDALKDESRGTATGGGGTRTLLVVAEVALSVVLLAGAGLTIRSFLALQRVELGFEPEHVMTVGVPLHPQRYATLEQRNRFARDFLEQARNLPGVQAATIGNGGLPFGGPRTAFAIDGRLDPPDQESRRIQLQLVGAEHLQTLGIPMRRGRMLTEGEINRSAPLAVINETAARLWPDGEDPVGRQIRLDELGRTNSANVLAPTNATSLVTVVGVVGDSRNDDLRLEPQPAALVPYTLLGPPRRDLAIRTAGDPRTVMNGLRSIVRRMDPEQPLNGPTTLHQILGQRKAQPRFMMALFTLFAALGLALAMAGIYSVLSFLVVRRTREIGLRMALGAQRGDVLRLILRSGAKPVGVGIVLGLGGSLAAARLLASRIELFQVTPQDPAAFVGVVTLVCAVAAAACWIPARRAARVDPMEALRHE